MELVESIKTKYMLSPVQTTSYLSFVSTINTLQNTIDFNIHFYDTRWRVRVQKNIIL